MAIERTRENALEICCISNVLQENTHDEWYLLHGLEYNAQIQRELVEQADVV